MSHCKECGSRQDAMHYIDCPMFRGVRGPCPSCARLAAKMKDREGLAKVLWLNDYAHHYHRQTSRPSSWGDASLVDQEYYLRMADAVIRWMEE